MCFITFSTHLMVATCSAHFVALPIVLKIQVLHWSLLVKLCLCFFVLSSYGKNSPSCCHRRRIGCTVKERTNPKKCMLSTCKSSRSTVTPWWKGRKNTTNDRLSLTNWGKCSSTMRKYWLHMVKGLVCLLRKGVGNFILGDIGGGICVLKDVEWGWHVEKCGGKPERCEEE